MSLTHSEVKRALADERLPVALVDLDAFDRNIERVVELSRVAGLPVRIASKSIRVRALLKRVLDRGHGRLVGVMAYSARECVFLAENGFKDLLLAYPPFRRPDLDDIARLASDGIDLSVCLDSAEAADALSEAANRAGTRVRTVLCVDMSWRLFGGRVALGVRRSPLHTPAEVVALARYVTTRSGLKFHGLMGYEAQVAGLGDANPFEPRMNAVKAFVRRQSAQELAGRRAEMVRQLRAAGLEPTLVNGGGTGSLDTTTPETGVTEGTAGSAFFKPHLFDYFANPHMKALEPASFFALEVVRHPAPGVVTCFGGGYGASGPVSADKCPLPWLPEGLTLLPNEGAGEVQTPLSVPAGVALRSGDPVLFRFAKAGEPMERFAEVLLLRGGEVVDRVPTYRGEGRCFG